MPYCGPKPLVRFGGVLQKGEDLSSVLLRDSNDGFALQHALGLLISGLDYELVNSRAQEFCGLFECETHLVRNASSDPFARVFQGMFHN